MAGIFPKIAKNKSFRVEQHTLFTSSLFRSLFPGTISKSPLIFLFLFSVNNFENSQNGYNSTFANTRILVSKTNKKNSLWQHNLAARLQIRKLFHGERRLNDQRLVYDVRIAVLVGVHLELAVLSLCKTRAFLSESLDLEIYKDIRLRWRRSRHVAISSY